MVVLECRSKGNCFGRYACDGYFFMLAGSIESWTNDYFISDTPAAHRRNSDRRVSFMSKSCEFRPNCRRCWSIQVEFPSHNKLFVSYNFSAEHVSWIGFVSIDLDCDFSWEGFRTGSSFQRTCSDPNALGNQVDIKIVLWDDDISIYFEELHWSRIYVHQNSPVSVDGDVFSSDWKSAFRPLRCV